MFRDKERYGQNPNIVVRSKTTFYDPLKWKEPRRIFTCSWSDFFIKEADPWRDEAFAIMALTPQHTYQVLTKRPERMLEYFADMQNPEIGDYLEGSPFAPAVSRVMWKLLRTSEDKQIKELLNAGHLVEMDTDVVWLKQWPPQNIWLGVSVEDQKNADERIPLLIETPAALRWLSIEPLLGPIDMSAYMGVTPNITGEREIRFSFVDWVVVGGESGPDARPMHPDWVRAIRDQCAAANVPFFVKQGSQANWPNFKKFDGFPEDLQIRQFPNTND